MVQAQNDTMYIMRSGVVINKHRVADVDSMIFHKPGTKSITPPAITSVSIPGGTFKMGSPITDEDFQPNETQHEVTVSAFKMSKYEITNAQYAGFLNANGIGANGLYPAGTYPTQTLIYLTNPLDPELHYNGGRWVTVAGYENHPVRNVTWYGATEFGVYAGGRLPTEAEWEYACRGNTTTRFNTGICLSSLQANFNWSQTCFTCLKSNTYPNKTQIVGNYGANAFGLHDMHGNVEEWCSDWFGEYSTAPQINPTGSLTGNCRVFRGGGFREGCFFTRSAWRNCNAPNNTGNSQRGFRLVMIQNMTQNVIQNDTLYIMRGGVMINKHKVAEVDSIIFYKPSTKPVMLPSIAKVSIPGGTFTLGSPVTEVGRGSNETQHQATLSGFKMSKYEITNAQYALFLNAKGIGSNGLYADGTYPSQALIYANTSRGLTYTGGKWVLVVGFENNPVINVTWYGATEFGVYAGGRLPTEAQWEYACRGNTTSEFNTGSCLSNLQANYNWAAPYNNCTNSVTTLSNTTQAVGSYGANAFGLHDMHGNVWEWCSDWYGTYPTTPQTNPTGSTTGTARVIRGGSWDSSARRSRLAYRNDYDPGSSGYDVGFRLVFVP